MTAADSSSRERLSGRRRSRALGRGLLAFSVLLVTSAPGRAAAPTPEESLRVALADPAIVDISGIEGVAIDLRYASARNFLGRDLYGPFNRAFLRKPAADKLARAAAVLRAARPGWHILVLDALRPRSVQRVFWASVAGTDQQRYVANPDKGSIHNYGFAVDVTLRDDSGLEVDMGTAFDDFSPRAEPRREAELLASGVLSSAQVANRQLLRQAMTQGGFMQLPVEWWHYDALSSAQARASHPILE
jgi:zinc D-Ala-D-Ala dipeptidase